MKFGLFLIASVYGGKGKRGGYEIWNEQGQVAYVDDTESRGADFGILNFANSERGPSRCMGEPIPSGIPHGKFICHRNLNNSGNKRGKKKKCRFQCDKGYTVSTKKAKGKGKDGVIKCHSEKGWLTKPKKLRCAPKN